MNYDVWGSWSSTVGPNAPLNDTCNTDIALQQGSAFSAVSDWFQAGFPVNQMVLGVASYGHSFHVKPADAYVSANRAAGRKHTLNANPVFNATAQPGGDKWDDAAGVDECGAVQLQGGLYDFWGMIDEGFLKEDGTAAKGIDYAFDECSQTVSIYFAVARDSADTQTLRSLMSTTRLPRL